MYIIRLEAIASRVEAIATRKREKGNCKKHRHTTYINLPHSVAAELTEQELAGTTQNFELPTGGEAISAGRYARMPSRGW